MQIENLGCYGLLMMIPGLSLRSNPGLKLANAFGVNSLRRYEPLFIEEESMLQDIRYGIRMLMMIL